MTQRETLDIAGYDAVSHLQPDARTRRLVTLQNKPVTSRATTPHDVAAPPLGQTDAA